MTGRALTKALARHVEATTAAAVTATGAVSGCTMQFSSFEDEWIELTTTDPDRVRQLLRPHIVVTVSFRDAHRAACFLAHVTAIDEAGTVRLSVPKQIVTRDQRIAPRVPISPLRRLWVVLTHDDVRLRGLTADVSLHGLGLQLEEGPPMPRIGTSVEVDIQLLAGRLTVMGTVMNVHGRRVGIRMDGVQAGDVGVADLVAMQFREWSQSLRKPAETAAEVG